MMEWDEKEEWDGGGAREMVDQVARQHSLPLSSLDPSTQVHLDLLA